MMFESIVKFELSSSGEPPVKPLPEFESIVKFELSSSIGAMTNSDSVFESIVKFELSSSFRKRLPFKHCLRVLLNLNYLHRRLRT